MSDDRTWMSKAEMDAAAKVVLAIQSSRGTDAEVSARHYDFIGLLAAWRKDRAEKADARHAENERCAQLLDDAAKTRESVAGPGLASSIEVERGAAGVVMVIAHELKEQAKRIRALLDDAGRGT